jgi:restriction endonuclease Mrr
VSEPDPLLDAIRAASPRDFLRLVIALLEGMGYIGAAKTIGSGPSSAPGAVQGIVDEEAGGSRAYVEAIQAVAPIDEPAAINFIAAIDRYRLQSGILIATTTFDAQARACCDESPHQIALIDGPRLATLARDLRIALDS